MPEVGKVCAVNYNGTAYDCPAVAIPDGMPLTGVLFGNSDAMGIPGGNTSAPFVVILYDAPVDDKGDGNLAHGAFIPMGEFAEGVVVTLSIVQTEGAASGSGSASAGGGIFKINVTVDMESVNQIENGVIEFTATADKTIAEMGDAIKNGSILQCHESVLTAGESGMVSIIQLAQYAPDYSSLFFMANFHGNTIQIAFQMAHDDSGDSEHVYGTITPPNA